VKLAKEKLMVYGLTEKEIEEVANENGVQKGKMILHSRAAGTVIKRTVVPGNYYDSKDELMQIAPLDHLWVWGSVSELDADKVQIGQKIRIIFPFSEKTIDSQVEYIDKAIDPETRSAKFRATIPNPEKRFKAGMFVRVLLEVPLKPDETVMIPGRSILRRLEGLRPKLDRLIRANADRTASPKFQEQVGELEQKLHQLLEEVEK
jgi:cobalt-zinc-cadmium efflux system membrane fusion protein